MESQAEMTEEEEFEFRRRLEQESQPVSASGVGAEVGKGLVRGVSDVALSMPKAVLPMALGPVAGPLAAKGIEALAAPSREMIAPRPVNETERFAGTAAELVGAGLTGGGSVKGALAMGLGGATGEQIGGETGKLIGAIATPVGMAGLRALISPVSNALSSAWTTIKAGFGNEKSVDKIVTDVVSKMAGEDRKRIVTALKGATEYVPGAKPTVGEAITQAQPAGEQVGGALVRLQKDLYGAKGVEDILPTTAKQQTVAIEAYREGLNKTTTPLRERALAQANVFGVRPESIVSRIDMELRKPGLRVSEVAQKSLGEIKTKIQELPGAQFGRVNAEDIYTLRKEIGNTINKFSKETQNWDKRLSAGLERKIQSYIDDAIEMAGGMGWRKYLETYSQGMKNIEMQESRLKAMKQLQMGVKSQAPSTGLAPELPKPPTLMRPVMIANFVLKLLERDADTPVAREIAKRLRDPAEFAKILEKPVTDPTRQAAEQLARQVSAAVAAQ